MINWMEVMPQINGLAENEVLRQARLGLQPWTPELARLWNRRWLAKNIPDRLAAMPALEAEGLCECGGLCLIGLADPGGVYHHCPKCGLTFYLKWSHYGSRDV